MVNQAGVKTYFAPPGLALPALLAQQVERVAAHPMTSNLLEIFGGVLVVLNADRQIIAANKSLLSLIGIENPDGVLGQRPGEALRCTNVDEAPSGCGTSKRCRSCGAVLAILACQKDDAPRQAECHVTVVRGEHREAHEFLARATPLKMGGQTFMALTLQDIRGRKRRDALQRVFFHDLLNVVSMLVADVDYLQDDSALNDDHELRQRIAQLTDEVVAIVREQRDLMTLESGRYWATPRLTTASLLVKDLETKFRNHALTTDRALIVDSQQDVEFSVDSNLLARVLTNMLKNAFEASPRGKNVRLWWSRQDDRLRFNVENEGEIPAQVAERVFERYFTTKDEEGRGLGTYGMKLLGERFLGGVVSFETSPAGTIFSIELPIKRQI